MAISESFTTYFNRDRTINLAGKDRGRKRTKLVATLGPATEDGEVLTNLLLAGANVCRFNMSHGSHEDHSRRLFLLRSISEDIDRPTAVLADLQGPKIRLGKFADGKVTWDVGKDVVITTDDLPLGTAERVGTTYKELSDDVNPGDTILIDDGRLRLTVLEVKGNDIHCTVVVGGIASNNKGINLPGVGVSAASLTDKDKDDLTWALENDVEFIALSFVSSATDIRNVKRRIAAAGKRIKVIAKIERLEAVDRMESIIAESDGIMVARGDLGIEINTERLPVVQKHLIARANAHGKLVITATQMLESMVHNPIPTRAESSDVANAIFDGTDAVMLSAETAAGAYPIEAAREVLNIAVEAEESPYMPTIELDRSIVGASDISFAVAQATNSLAKDMNADAVMVFCESAEQARLLSKLRCSGRIICCCHDEITWRQLSPYWGSVPIRVDACTDPQDHLDAGLAEARRIGVLAEDSTVVVVMGSNDLSNAIRVVRV